MTQPAVVPRRPSGPSRRAGLAGTLELAYWALQSRLGKHARLARRFVRQHGLAVSGGPFAGLRYTPRTAVGRIVAKLIGSYEEELHEQLAGYLRTGPATIVNVGSAEGYYAVGLARALPHVRVYAFEADAARRELCAELAVHNGVAERVLLRGACDAGELARLPHAGDLVLCDCEGFEHELLRPDAVAWLRHAQLLVELHEGFVPGVTQAIATRFAASHALRLVPEQPRDPARYPALSGFTDAERRELLDEYRKDDAGRPLHMEWAVLTPRGA